MKLLLLNQWVQPKFVVDSYRPSSRNVLEFAFDSNEKQKLVTVQARKRGIKCCKISLRRDGNRSKTLSSVNY